MTAGEAWPDMSRQRRVSQVFLELADTLVDDFDALDILHTLADRCVELLDVDAAGIILSDQRGGLQSVASTSHEADLIELFMLQNDEGPCLDCMRTGEPVINVSLADARWRWPRFCRGSSELGYRSAHALPLRLRSEVIGAMNLFAVSRVELSSEDAALGQALADVATIALLQERVIGEKQLLAEQLQYALDNRILVEQARGVLAERLQVDVDQAFALLRVFSRRHRLALRDVASLVINGSLSGAQLAELAGHEGG